MMSSPTVVWATATFMVTIVSCCSLVGVSIMPLISGPSYKVFITLFTGLAVGSLLGSAIFSLIPQAFKLHLQPDRDYLWKSLIIFIGIYLFYMSERLMRIYFSRKEKQNAQQEQHLQLKRNKSNSAIADEPACGDTVPDDDKTIATTRSASVEKSSSSGRELAFIGDEIQIQSDIQQQHVHHHHHHHHSHGEGLRPHDIITKSLKGDTNTKVSSGLPSRKGQIAPLAWMIIIGDALHNFIDGLSIGAAFSESISLGLSTSVAVIFEEFPHELGDFAVLISSGMTVRQALGFNFLSACTCYIGMIFGILLGDTTSSASYIFALAAGMFLYISLVDMMGELSAMLEESKHSTRETSHLLVMQNLGILSGIVIIFFLSLYGSA